VGIARECGVVSKRVRYSRRGGELFLQLLQVGHVAEEAVGNRCEAVAVQGPGRKGGMSGKKEEKRERKTKGEECSKVRCLFLRTG
jgi:hypothetical protein